MPRAKVGLTPSEYAVLGLLAEGPDYGYRLQQYFAGGAGLARVCPIDSSMVYAILKSLSGLELIDGAWDSRQYPPKAVYSITPGGEANFDRWLRSPVGRIRDVRSEFLIKLFFAMRRDHGLARDLVEEQIGVCEDLAARHAVEIAAVPGGSFDALAIQSKLTAANLTRAWLEQCRDQLPSPARAARASQRGPARTGRGRRAI